MKEINQKHLLDTFSEKLGSNFSTFCEKHGQEKNIHQFITFVLDQQLIPPSNIRKYTVQETFEEAIDKSDSKTQAVRLLAERFDLSVRSIWNLLKG